MLQHGTSPLHIAANLGHVDTVELLLTQKDRLRINQHMEKNKRTSLMGAITSQGKYHNRLRIVQLLLNAGCNRNLVDNVRLYSPFTPICIDVLCKIHAHFSDNHLGFECLSSKNRRDLQRTCLRASEVCATWRLCCGATSHPCLEESCCRQTHKRCFPSIFMRTPLSQRYVLNAVYTSIELVTIRIYYVFYIVYQ